jgi:hypothetical protein
MKDMDLKEAQIKSKISATYLSNSFLKFLISRSRKWLDNL